MSDRKAEDFSLFLQRVQDELMTHRVITQNEYCAWFKVGDFSIDHLRHFTIQFSVFSNLFLIAQLKKTINAVDLEEMRKAKEILANEIGCIFRRTDGHDAEMQAKQVRDQETFGDPKLVSTQGTVDGGQFKFQAAHFEWLLHFGEPLGLDFSQMGKRSHGSQKTLFFCDELERLYGSEDFNISAGASYAVENWAAAGFWKDLSAGIKVFKEANHLKLPMGFFTWHDKVEEQHKADTQEELEELYFGDHAFDEDKFIEAGYEMLDGVAAFWDGLNRDRLRERGRVNV